MEDILNFFLSSPMNMAMGGAGGLAVAVISFYLFKPKKKKSSKVDLVTASSIGYTPVDKRERTQLDETMDSSEVSLLIKPKNNQYLDKDSEKEITKRQSEFSLPVPGESMIDIVFDKPSVHQAVKIKPQEETFKNIPNYKDIPVLTEIISPLAVKPPVFTEVAQDEIKDNEWNLSQFEEEFEPKAVTVSPKIEAVPPIIAPVIAAPMLEEKSLLDAYELNLEENSVSNTESVITMLPLPVLPPVFENHALEKTDYNDYILEALNFDSQNDKKSALMTMKEACAHIKNIKILFYFKMAIQSYENATTDNKLPEIIDHFYYMERQKRRQEGEIISNHPPVAKKQEEEIKFPLVESQPESVASIVPTPAVKSDNFDGFPPISDMNDIGKYQIKDSLSSEQFNHVNNTPEFTSINSQETKVEQSNETVLMEQSQPVIEQAPEQYEYRQESFYAQDSLVEDAPEEKLLETIEPITQESQMEEVQEENSVPQEEILSFFDMKNKVEENHVQSVEGSSLVNTDLITKPSVENIITEDFLDKMKSSDAQEEVEKNESEKNFWNAFGDMVQEIPKVLKSETKTPETLVLPKTKKIIWVNWLMTKNGKMSLKNSMLEINNAWGTKKAIDELHNYLTEHAGKNLDGSNNQFAVLSVYEADE